MNMNIRKKYALPLVILLCSVTLIGCDTYYYGLRKSSHHSKVNSSGNMYVHKDTQKGVKQYSTSYASKPAGMFKQRKVK